ncbi:MAG: hypothetical protein ACM3L5_00475, partial [Candidatus Saccharibacteria bacterium]
LDRIITYDWTLTKEADATSAELGIGKQVTVNYWLNVSRTVASTEDLLTVSGTISVVNSGYIATQGLAVYDQVQACVDGTWVAVDGTFQQITISSQLAAGATGNYEYTTQPFEPVIGATAYRNVAEAMITNYHGYPGQNAGKQTIVGWDVPSEPAITEVNAAAGLSDVFTTIPSPGFNVAGTSFTTVTVNDGNLVDGKYVSEFAVTVTNTGANTLGVYYLNNTATLAFTSATLTDKWSVAITTPFYSGYVYTIGYWKNHAGFGHQADVLTTHLPVWLGTVSGTKSVEVTSASQAVSILSMSNGASNGIVKLQAQLLAAKLNIKAGASNTVSSTINAADAFLAAHLWQDWSNLSKSDQKTVLSWMSILDQYNNGLLGPMHAG